MYLALGENMSDSDYTPEEKKKITSTLSRIKEIYKDGYTDDKSEIFTTLAEILEDPYYKENMTYYFQKFLTERY